jgi:hypothetical protein
MPSSLSAGVCGFCASLQHNPITLSCHTLVPAESGRFTLCLCGTCDAQLYKALGCGAPLWRASCLAHWRPPPVRCCQQLMAPAPAAGMPASVPPAGALRGPAAASSNSRRRPALTSRWRGAGAPWQPCRVPGQQRSQRAEMKTCQRHRLWCCRMLQPSQSRLQALGAGAWWIQPCRPAPHTGRKPAVRQGSQQQQLGSLSGGRLVLTLA